MPLIQTEAIVLRRRRVGEADALLTLLTQDQGKLIASTKSVVKTTSRYAGLTQSFNHIYGCFYAKTRDQDIWTLTQASLIQTYDLIQTDLTRVAYISCIAEWVEYFAMEHEPTPRLWALLRAILERWNAQTPSPEDLIFYQLHLLLEAGVQPHIDSCMHCQAIQSPGWHYSEEEGGLLCSQCGQGNERLTAGAVVSLRKMMQSVEPVNLRLSLQQKKEISLLLKGHLEYHIGLKSKAALFLEQIIRNQ